MHTGVLQKGGVVLLTSAPCRSRVLLSIDSAIENLRRSGLAFTGSIEPVTEEVSAPR